MGMVQEFKEFALKGSVMDLAVGVIIGAAFGKIVDSVVNDLIMPVVSRFTGGLDFSNLFIPLRGGRACRDPHHWPLAAYVASVASLCGRHQSSCSRYHAMVLARPDSKSPNWGSQPSSLRSRPESIA